MREYATLEDLASILRSGGALSLVESSLSKPQNLTQIVDGNAELQFPIWVDGIPYDALVFASARTVATPPFNLEHPNTILLRVAVTVEFLHSRTLVHGNLNIDAISMIGSTAVVSGFEHCNIQLDESDSGPTRSPKLPGEGNDWARRPPGHLPSMAPELVASGIRTTQTDVYAFGVLMFRMYAGKHPFDEVKSRYGVAAIARLGGGKRPPREDIQHEHFTDDLWVLMTECWAQEASARPTMAAVRARLAQMV